MSWRRAARPGRLHPVCGTGREGQTATGAHRLSPHAGPRPPGQAGPLPLPQGETEAPQGADPQVPGAAGQRGLRVLLSELGFGWWPPPPGSPRDPPASLCPSAINAYEAPAVYSCWPSPTQGTQGLGIVPRGGRHPASPTKGVGSASGSQESQGPHENAGIPLRKDWGQPWPQKAPGAVLGSARRGVLHPQVFTTPPSPRGALWVGLCRAIRSPAAQLPWRDS